MMFSNTNVTISPTAKIGKNVRIGDNTTIYDNVTIDDDAIIASNCLIGEPTNDYYFQDSYKNPPTLIGKKSLIRSHTILYAGSKFGEQFSTGHRVTVRENSIFGNNCRLGTSTDIQGHSEFGQYCWLHSSVHVGQNSKIGNFVFLYPFVVLTNDPSPPSNVCNGVTIGDFSQIATSSVLLPGANIGKHCLIGAQSLVNGNFEDYSLVVGNPGRRIKDIRDLKIKQTGNSHYPWPKNFDRGMPWQEVGFDNWKILNGYEND